ncbi:MAG: hypothetical protein ACAI44_14725 [Candidatus Sericytochromatia bacterium]
MSLSILSLKLALGVSLGILPLMSGKGFLFVGNNQPGHFQVTEDTAREFGFSQSARRLMADASMDPDFYEWSHSAAHAQTGNDTQGVPNESEAQAVAHLYAWLDDKLAHVEQSLQAGQPRAALYWLGYSLHAVEDLSPHQGISNAQHAYLSAIGQNPDLNPAALTLAHRFAWQYLWGVRDKLGDAAWTQLIHFQGLPLSGPEKDKLLGHTWDISLGEVMTYQSQGDYYKSLAQRPEIHWDAPKVLEGYIQTLK